MADSKLIGIGLILVHIWAVIFAQNAGDTLVLVDNLAIRETHSIFFKGLQGKSMPVNLLSAYKCVCLHMTNTDVSVHWNWCLKKR